MAKRGRKAQPCPDPEALRRMLEVERLTITAATHRMGLSSLKAIRRWIIEHGITVHPREMGRVQRQRHGVGSAYPSQSKLYREFDTDEKIAKRFTPAVLATSRRKLISVCAFTAPRG
jgi:hypothetical protein